MANSFVRYTGNGSTDAFAVPFSYRAQADVAVTVDGVAVTAYTWNGAGTVITFTTAPLNLTSIEIRRTTSQTTRLVDYEDGSVLTENTLDTDSNQAFFMGQEAIDDANDRILLDAADFQWDAQSKRIKNVANPTANQDAVTKYYLENTWLSTSDKADIATLAAISGLSTLAGITSDITAVAADATDIGAVAAKATEIGRLGTADAVADLALLGTSAIVTDLDLLATSANVTAMGLLGNSTTVTNMGLLGTSAVVTDMGLLGTSAVVTDLDAVADKVTEIGRLGTADAVADLAILGTADVVTDMNLLATADVVADMALLGTASVIANMALLGTADAVADMNTLATSDIVSDLNLLATSDIVSDLNQLATSDFVSDLNAMEAVKANITTCADNLTGINNFADTYSVGSTNPTGGTVNAGDIFFNTSDSQFKYYTGSTWASVTAGIGSVADDTTPQLGGDLDLNSFDIPASNSVKGFAIAMAVAL